VCFGGGQIRVAEAGQAAEHLRKEVPVEAPIDPRSLSEEIFLGEVCRELEDVGARRKPAASGREKNSRATWTWKSVKASGSCLDYPRWFSLQRVFRRAVTRAIDKQPICHGNTESFHAMLGRDSIIGWHSRSFGRKRGRMRTWAAAAEGPAVLLFTRSKNLQIWIDTLGDRAANGTTVPRAQDRTESC